ncbi:dTDP-4-dehydrorhamnose reductase [Hymenobacter lutimineralis]|uniref:dTDP-4-dehydrorhamnose reductase n=1 Tax=Hymenobacter lutimineralis TaxID=2606448 RepID=A0A5D6UUZ8_9BACT|nr:MULTISPECIES: dTDP-4-dehydrorhamnose reductase [Hymenobacter]QIX62366.1 dTDP-4-dehydrorhamnose reductase [Hymenobacter sp. BT18]TYZ06264.1 dTDP-4-dehydrorhamnose reductase [Hymenobacter lutimineralis]
MGVTLVFGAAGQLGQCLQQLGRERQLTNLIFLPRTQANILDEAALQSVFTQYRPTYLINCAAYTAVDKAEEEADTARRVNRDGVENLARLCGEFGTTLLHVSTDFVFAGTGNQPLIETDEAAPISVYGRTKLEGEQVIPAHTGQYFILRTSWLYSRYAGNFVKTMLRLGQERSEVRVIWDQLGTPTYALDLADCLLHIIDSGSTAYGLYHYSNEGVASWYDLAVAVFELSGLPTRVVPIRTAEYPTSATRPTFSVLDKTNVKAALGLAIPHWRESLKACLRQLA